MSDSRAFQSAVAWAREIRAGSISSADALELYLARVDRHNPAINAIVCLDIDGARARARAADAALARGEIWGALHGVPITVKESFDVPGFPTTWGVPELAGNIARRPAASVERLCAQGAVVFGKTNVPTMLADWQTFNPLYGTTRNPWDLTRAPGGSSGGAAAALAAGLTALELGSDIGASIRNPAHYCGVYGHKPSFGVVPQAGHAIPGADVPLDVLVCGPLARASEDLALALDTLTGPEPDDAAAWSIELPATRIESLRGARVAVWLEDASCKVDVVVTDRIQAVADALAKAGARVDDKARPVADSGAAHALYLQLLRGATGALLTDAEYAKQRALAAQVAIDDRSYVAQTSRGATQTHRAWFEAHRRRAVLRREWAAFFQRYDVLLCPTAASPAFVHNQQVERAARRIPVNGSEEDYNDQLFWAGLASLAYLPATVAPAGRTPSGLPVGVQIVGGYLQDHTTIAFAGLLERSGIGGFTPPPGYA